MPVGIYERIYIHAAKVRTREGVALMLISMDGYSLYAFEPVWNEIPIITLEVLNQLFNNIFEDYNPLYHPKQIVFVTSLPIEFDGVLKKSIAKHHWFIYNKSATLNAMSELLEAIPGELDDF